MALPVLHIRGPPVDSTAALSHPNPRESVELLTHDYRPEPVDYATEKEEDTLQARIRRERIGYVDSTNAVHKTEQQGHDPIPLPREFFPNIAAPKAKRLSEPKIPPTTKK